MAKIHWAAGPRETSCGLIYPVKNVGLTVHVQEVTCLRCQKAIPEVVRTRWDILNSEDGEVPKAPRKPKRKRRPKEAPVVQDRRPPPTPMPLTPPEAPEVKAPYKTLVFWLTWFVSIGVIAYFWAKAVFSPG